MSGLEASVRGLLFYSSLKMDDTRLNVPTITRNWGEYPINAWKHYPLEIPKGGANGSVSGRCYQAFGPTITGQKWDKNRIIKLPVYPNAIIRAAVEDCGTDLLRTLIREWNVSYTFDETPILAVAFGVAGHYCDFREFQTATVLPIWHDAVGRILTLDWAEGPLEDCITPEWHSNSTRLLGLEKTIEQVRKLYDHTLPWDDLSFFVYMIPPFLGSYLRGEGVSCDLWHGWKYDQESIWREDLDFVFSWLIEAFYGEDGG